MSILRASVKRQKEIKVQNTKKILALFKNHKKANHHRRYNTNSDIRTASKEDCDDILMQCQHCPWKSIVSGKWEDRIYGKCENCTEFFYNKEVREIRNDAKDLLEGLKILAKLEKACIVEDKF